MINEVQTRGVVDTATANLREAIIDGTYLAGAHLVEQRIAAALGISSIAVREAFGRLASEGLVTRVPRRGTFVASQSRDSLRDLTRVRVALELVAVDLVAENWSREADATLRKLVDAMFQAARESESAAFFEADQRFHEAFWSIANSPILLEIAGLLRTRLAGFLRAATLSRGRNELLEAAEIHQSWVDAIAAGDVAAARREVERQIVVTYEKIIAALEPA